MQPPLEVVSLGEVVRPPGLSCLSALPSAYDLRGCLHESVPKARSCIVHLALGRPARKARPFLGELEEGCLQLGRNLCLQLWVALDLSKVPSNCGSAGLKSHSV